VRLGLDDDSHKIGRLIGALNTGLSTTPHCVNHNSLVLLIIVATLQHMFMSVLQVCARFGSMFMPGTVDQHKE